MSSSRIIKGNTGGRQQIAEFCFGALQDGFPAPSTAVSTDDFQPMFIGDPIPARGPEQPEPAGHDHEEGSDEAGIGAEELQRLLQESCDRGFADGRREAEESFNAVCRTFSDAVESISDLRERLVRECEEDLLRLAMMVAKQVIRHEISQDRKILAQFVSEAAAGLTDPGEIVICFNPDDFRLVSANRQLYLAGVGDKVQVSIKADEQVSVGGCVIETQTGVVDAQVETQLAEIFKRLMQERGHGSDETLELPAKADQYLTEQSGAEKYGYQRD